MALVPGDITASSGLAQRIANYLEANAVACGFQLPSEVSMPSDRTDKIRALAYCIAAAVVDEITANGEAVISITTGALQLEKDNTGNYVNTIAPIAERTLPLR